MKQLERLLVCALLGLVACVSPSADEDAESAEADLSATACSGAACTALAGPTAPLLRGGLAVIGHELHWVAAGSDGDELRHCTLPACAEVTAVPIVVSGVAVRAAGLRPVGNAVFFTGTKPGAALTSFFVYDGVSFAEVYSSYDTQHDRFAVDETGLLVYERDRRTDGWARSSLRHCPWQGPALSRTCTTHADASLNHVGDIALTPTRAVVVRSSDVRSFDRATLGDARGEPITARSGRTRLIGVGEKVLGWMPEVTHRGGRVEHDTAYFAGGFENGVSGMIDGVLSATTSDATRLYLGSVGEGDVWGRPKTGVLAKVYPTSGKKSVRATSQDVHGIAVDGARLYWLDRTSPADAEEDLVGVVRTVAR